MKGNTPMTQRQALESKLEKARKRMRSINDEISKASRYEVRQNPHGMSTVDYHTRLESEIELDVRHQGRVTEALLTTRVRAFADGTVFQMKHRGQAIRHTKDGNDPSVGEKIAIARAMRAAADDLFWEATYDINHNSHAKLYNQLDKAYAEKLNIERAIRKLDHEEEMTHAREISAQLAEGEGPEGPDPEYDEYDRARDIEAVSEWAAGGNDNNFHPEDFTPIFDNPDDNTTEAAGDDDGAYDDIHTASYPHNHDHDLVTRIHSYDYNLHILKYHNDDGSIKPDHPPVHYDNSRFSIVQSRPDSADERRENASDGVS